jgi:hypothetical protein
LIGSANDFFISKITHVHQQQDKEVRDAVQRKVRPINMIQCPSDLYTLSKVTVKKFASAQVESCLMTDDSTYNPPTR